MKILVPGCDHDYYTAVVKKSTVVHNSIDDYYREWGYEWDKLSEGEELVTRLVAYL